VTAQPISVIVPVYNAVAYLGEAIESVLGQSYSPIELIVVDDGSDDGSEHVALGYGERLTYLRQERAGNGAARNRGVQVAGADYYAFLDADDRFLPDKLERQMAVLEADPTVEAVFGHVREFVTPELESTALALLRKPIENAPWLAPNLMLIRREAFDRVGPFSEELRVGVTVDWFARANEKGLRYVMLPEVVLERRLHAANNGIREGDARSSYLQVLKASIDRRRAAEG
jgi:glycosyltransferase involved in cell wall biosynthesis